MTKTLTEEVQSSLQRPQQSHDDSHVFRDMILSTISWINVVDAVKKSIREEIRSLTEGYPIRIDKVIVGWRDSEVTERPGVEICYFLEDGLNITMLTELLQKISDRITDLSLDESSPWHDIDIDETMKTVDFGYSAFETKPSRFARALWFTPILKEGVTQNHEDLFKEVPVDDGSSYEEIDRPNEETAEVIDEIDESIYFVENTNLEPESELVEEISVNDYHAEQCFGSHETNPGIILSYRPVWNCEVQDVKVFRHNYKWSTAPIYYLLATIGGTTYRADIDDLIGLYLERGEDGRFTRRFTKEMLVQACFREQLDDHAIIRNAVVAYYGKAVPFEKGLSPVFERDEDFVPTLDIPMGTLGAAVVNQDKKYFLSIWLDNVKRTAILDNSFPDWLYETDEDGNQPIYSRPETAMSCLVLEYFGHDIEWALVGKTPEYQTDLVISSDGGPQPYRFEAMMPEAKADYDDYILPKGYSVKDVAINYFDKEQRYLISYTLEGEITRNSNILFKRRYGLALKVYMTDEDVANFLERDKDGHFTKRVTAEHIARKYAMNTIREYEAIIKMQKAGIPGMVMEDLLGISKDKLRSFLREYGYQRNNWANTAFIPQKKREAIRDSYRQGTTLMKLKEKYKFPDYAILYSILKKDFNRKWVLPEELDIQIPHQETESTIMTIGNNVQEPSPEQSSNQ